MNQAIGALDVLRGTLVSASRDRDGQLPMMSGNPYLHTGARTTRLVSCSSLPGRTATRGGKLKSFVHNCPSSPGRRWRCRKWNGGSGQGRAGTRKIDGGGRHVFRGWGHSPSDTQATGATGSCQVSCLFYSLDENDAVGRADAEGTQYLSSGGLSIVRGNIQEPRGGCSSICRFPMSRDCAVPRRPSCLLVQTCWRRISLRRRWQKAMWIISQLSDGGGRWCLP